MIDGSDIRQFTKDNASTLATLGSAATVAGFGLASLVAWPLGIGIAIAGIVTAGAGFVSGGTPSLESIGLASAAPVTKSATQLATAPAKEKAISSQQTAQIEVVAPKTPAQGMITENQSRGA